MAATNSKKPNFLIIVADDLGYSDVGCYGGEIRTPNIDRLAREGIRMSNFHTASACSPTRSMLFSGTDNHIAGLGQMFEHMGGFGEYFEGKPGYEGYLNWRVAALTEILDEAGYLNIMSGKWHLGLTKPLAPCSRGFHKNFTFLPGSGNHHGYEPQLDADDPPIHSLCTDGHWMEGDKFLDRKTQLPPNFYSTVSFTDKMLSMLGERTDEEKEKPFFAYLAYTAPHWPLQAPDDRIARYAGKYDDGPDELAKRRLTQLKKLDLVPQDCEVSPSVGHIGKEWSDMSAQDQAASAKKMQAFAAMVDIVDENIGRVLDYLESTGELDNTFVLFMSDNGAEGAALEALPMMGRPVTMAQVIEKHYNNSFENIGKFNSFTWYGPRWACAASVPSRGFKFYTTEGGIRCPCVIRYPPFGAQASSITHSFTTVMDILPTVLSLADIKHPGPTFRGREIALPRGKSWAEHLSSNNLEETSVHGEDVHIHGWELFGFRAIREGYWKAVYMAPPRGKGDWELYDMRVDRSEQTDLADKHPDVLEKLIEHWEVYYAETGMVQGPPDFHV